MANYIAKYADYGATWIDERPGLRPKTVTLYRYLLRSHIAPYFPAMTVAQLKLAAVRRWHKKLLDNGVSPVTTAKAYRLLRAIMYTAVEDGLIRRNPCRIKGAGSEDSPERPVLTVAQVYALADSARLRLSSSPARTASRSGIATSTAVSGCLPLLLSAWPVFIFTTCGILTTSSDAGANPRELMARMGHDSARAALIYLHSSAKRQRALANEVGRNARAALSQPVDKPKRSGTRKAHNRKEAW